MRVNITGGTFSGNGTVGLNFYPSNAGVGSHEITYTYQDVNNCSSSDIRYITVISPEMVSIGGNETVCIYDTDLDLTVFEGVAGGVWSGDGVTDGSTFSGALAGVGPHTITYAVPDVNGCLSTSNKIIEVIDYPTVEAGADIFVCNIGTVFVGLDGTAAPIGGSWSGTYVAGGNFDVSASG